MRKAFELKPAVAPFRATIIAISGHTGPNLLFRALENFDELFF